MLEDALYLFYMMGSIMDFLSRMAFSAPLVSKNQNVLYYEKSYNFPLIKKTYFPAYAKTSKMTYDNRYGRYINLERRVKGRKRLKWK